MENPFETGDARQGGWDDAQFDAWSVRQEAIRKTR